MGSGWGEAVSGHILSTSLATCTGGSGRELDYFIVSEGLQYRHTLTVLTDVGTKPHYPVRLCLDGAATSPHATTYSRTSHVPSSAASLT
eukprot:9441615-Pyramimonas_sp.AAC.1